MNTLTIKEYVKKGKVDSYLFLFIFMVFLGGVVFFNLINLKWTDELLALYLMFVFGYKFVWFNITIIKPVLLVFGISLFYLIYLFYSNPIAIISDYVTQVKQYIAFFCTLAIAPLLRELQRKNKIKILFYNFHKYGYSWIR